MTNNRSSLRPLVLPSKSFTTTTTTSRSVVRPQRIGLSRRKGFRLQHASRKLNGLPAVKVTRPSTFGNPFAVSALLADGEARDKQSAHDRVVEWFRDWLGPNRLRLRSRRPDLEQRRREILKRAPLELRGKNLACWCRSDESCHADVLLEIANARV